MIALVVSVGILELQSYSRLWLPLRYSHRQKTETRSCAILWTSEGMLSDNIIIIYLKTSEY